MSSIGFTTETGREAGRRGSHARWGFKLDIERFWEKVDTTSQDCWEWQANRDSKNYGRFRLTSARRPVLAHRFAYEDVMGHISKGSLVLHKCDNPPCVNPKHLYLGTHLDNRRDAYVRGRQWQGLQANFGWGEKSEKTGNYVCKECHKGPNAKPLPTCPVGHQEYYLRNNPKNRLQN